MISYAAYQRIGFGFAFIVVLLGLTLAWLLRDRPEEMVRVTLDWGRLAPFPASAEQFTIHKRGSMFTRAFRASFSAPPADIDRWLRESPGTRDVTPQRPTPTTRFYSITPGGGAQRAEVSVDDETGLVSVYVCWS